MDDIPFVVSKLSCFRHQVIFSDITFKLRQGEILLVTGENGVGKSSLLRLLAGISSPYEGSVLWYGKSIQRLGISYTNQLHYINHVNGLKLNLTVTENLLLGHHLHLVETSGITPILGKLNLSAQKNTLVRYLSAGQKRRVALAKLFLINKHLWLLDEPLTALDVYSQAFFLSQLNSHLNKGGICVLSSHQSIPLPTQSLQILRMTTC